MKAETRMSGASLQRAGNARATARLLLRQLRDDERGSIFVEYVTILSFVAFGCVIAIIALGVPLVRYFSAQAAILGLPIP
jgi:Flp pilus assembly pilin Flp